MNRKSKLKKTMIIVFITVFLLCSLCPNHTANNDVKDKKIDILLPYLNKLQLQNKPNSVDNLERSGWPQIFDKGIEDSANSITIDTQGNIIVTGYTGYTTENSTDVIDFLTIKYDSQGNEIWNVTYDSGTFDFAWDIITDSENNIIIYGFNYTTRQDLEDFNLTYRVLKYNKNGIELWNITHNPGIDNFPGGIDVDSNDCIFFNGGTGDLDGLDFHCWTMKCDSDGVELWNKTFKEDIISLGSDVAIDSDDNVLVGGMVASFMGQGYAIIRYDGSGNKLSVHRYNRATQPNAIAVDSSDNIIISGQSYSSETNSSSWYTIKSDKNGNLLWAREFDTNAHEYSNDVAVDSNGNVVTVGGSQFSADSDYEHCAVIYDKDGNEICLKKSGIYGFTHGIAINEDDNIFYAGSIQFGMNWDYYIDFYTDIAPPSVVTTKPIARSLYILNTKLFSLPTNTFIFGRLTIELIADDPSDVTKVEFYINNDLKQIVTSPPYDWMWNERLFGKYNVKTMTYDETGSIARYELKVWKFF